MATNKNERYNDNGYINKNGEREEETYLTSYNL